jgi:hypothetical protein
MVVFVGVRMRETRLRERKNEVLRRLRCFASARALRAVAAIVIVRVMAAQSEMNQAWRMASA